METFKNIFENLKEQLKNAWAAQQESALFIAIKEKFEGLPPMAQKVSVWSLMTFSILIIMWWPLSNLLTANDLNVSFEEKRQLLRDLVRIERDLASAPNVSSPPAPTALKSQFDQRIAGAGVLPEQILGQEIPESPYFGTNQRGYQYKISKLTIRQAIDIAYELEHADPSLKLSSFSVTADAADPHYYYTTFKVINFAPKIAAGFSSGALADALKKSGSNSKSAPAEDKQEE
ncbi:MAG: hypothetical protein SGI74_12175 [Oligoflexia bacterium]|nr:hypothetical protein [Oligoflexia bacterium]